MVIFISYQRADTLFAAHAVGYAVRNAGHQVFVDTGSINGGELFPQAISNAIAQSNIMFALIGPGFDFSRLYEDNNVVAFEWRRAQFHGVAVVPILVDGGKMPLDDGLPAKLRWFTKRNAYLLRRESLSTDISKLIEDIPVLAKEPKHAARVLWVDDNPANNEFERKALRPHGIIFDNVVSTSEALDQMNNESYDLIITDLSRTDSSDGSRTAGANFLTQATVVKGPPVIVYAGYWVEKQKPELIKLGASEATSSCQQLFDSVLGLLGRGDLPE